MQIENKVFIVTGGASGLGAATAQMLVKAGAKVMLVDLNAEAVAAQALKLGDQARSAVADISQADAAQAAVAATVAAFGTVNGLVNCAGIVRGEKILGKNGPHGLETFSQVINVNLIGSFNMLRLAAAAIAETTADAEGERGVIINTASIAAFEGQIGQAAYAASKAGVAAMALPMARELARYGIRVNTIAPGLFLTPMMEALPQDVQDALGKATPFPPRLGRPAEFAAMARSIVENVMVNAELIRLDGAVRLAGK